MYIIKYLALVHMAEMRKLVRPSPYELVPIISQYAFKTYKYHIMLSHTVKRIRSFFTRNIWHLAAGSLAAIFTGVYLFTCRTFLEIKIW